jgi:hypothetical protein
MDMVDFFKYVQGEFVHPPKRYPIRGTRTNLLTGKSWEVELEWYLDKIKNISNDWTYAFFLIGGPTGYESFCFSEYWHQFQHYHQMCNEGWCACAGTEGRWDRLQISGAEMKKALDKALELMERDDGNKET